MFHLKESRENQSKERLRREITELFQEINKNFTKQLNIFVPDSTDIFNLLVNKNKIDLITNKHRVTRGQIKHEITSRSVAELISKTNGDLAQEDSTGIKRNQLLIDIMNEYGRLLSPAPEKDLSEFHRICDIALNFNVYLSTVKNFAHNIANEKDNHLSEDDVAVLYSQQNQKELLFNIAFEKGMGFFELEQKESLEKSFASISSQTQEIVKKLQELSTWTLIEKPTGSIPTYPRDQKKNIRCVIS